MYEKHRSVLLGRHVHQLGSQRAEARRAWAGSGEAATDMNYDCKVAAYSVSEATTYGPDADIILLGPQIRFNLNKVRGLLPGKIVEVIDMRAYGMLDGKSVINFVKQKLGD